MVASSLKYINFAEFFLSSKTVMFKSIHYSSNTVNGPEINQYVVVYLTLRKGNSEIIEKYYFYFQKIFFFKYVLLLLLENRSQRS